MPDIKTLAKARDIDLANAFARSIEKLAKMLSTWALIMQFMSSYATDAGISGYLAWVIQELSSRKTHFTILVAHGRNSFSERDPQVKMSNSDPTIFCLRSSPHSSSEF